MILFRQGCHFDFAGLKMARYGHVMQIIQLLISKLELSTSLLRASTAGTTLHQQHTHENIIFCRKLRSKFFFMLN